MCARGLGCQSYVQGRQGAARLLGIYPARQAPRSSKFVGEGLMKLLLRVVVVMLILATTFVAGRLANAQAPQTVAPMIISGMDVGFRVDADATRRNGQLTGTWVVR